MKVYIVLGFGTFGKSVGKALKRLFAFYGREEVPSAALDSDPGDFLPTFILPLQEDSQLDVSFDGESLREALKRGEYPRLAHLDRELLKGTKTRSGFGLYPALGVAAATLNQPTLRDLLRRLCQGASDILTSQGGELVVVRCFSSFGGTSRGLAWESGEILWEISQKTGMKVHLMDLVGISSLGISASQFAEEYLRNSFAFVKEAAALRAEEFRRLLYDGKGVPVEEERVAVLPSTLILVGDCGTGGCSLSEELHATTIARFIELLTRRPFSDAFFGEYANLIRHGTQEPYAARLGLFSLYLPDREEALVRHATLLSCALDQMASGNGGAQETARRMLERLGLRAQNTSTLRLLSPVKKRLLDRLGHDPVATFAGLFAQTPADYFDEYKRFTEELRQIDGEALAREVAEELKQGGAVELELEGLKVAVLPGEIPTALQEAVALLERDRDEIRGAVKVADQGVEAEEQNAGAAQEAFRALTRRGWQRLLERIRGRTTEDALGESKAHLKVALERRMDLLALGVFASVLDQFLHDLRAGRFPSWNALHQEAQEMVAALRDLKADEESRKALLLGGRWDYRGAGSPLGGPERFRGEGELKPMAAPLLEKVRPCLPTLYGASAEAIRREVEEGFRQHLAQALPPQWTPLTPKVVTLGSLREALGKAAPLSPIDPTQHSSRKVLFVATEGGTGSALRPLIQQAMVGAGRIDQERWLNLGPDLADELLFVSFEEGVPLRAFKAIAEARILYQKSPTRTRGHLEPLFSLLPDPLGKEIDERRLFLLGRLTEALRRSGSGDLIYIDGEGKQCRVDRTFLGRYETAVDLTSRFIAQLRREGFAAVEARLKALMASDGLGAEVYAVALELLDELEGWAEAYHEPIEEEVLDAL